MAFSQNGDLYGNVKFDTKEPVLGAYIILKSSSFQKEANSDINGDFYFENIPYGNYTLQLHSLNAEVKTIDITINTSEKTLMLH
ncbi:TonB-dependent receptor [Algibacter lectus]|uniref:TonB-dependent receptor n=1 Tax=Algibacter lectus TaxID=221126 RepID=A0A090WVL1_9FLAO|nr:TonB-dependent receptor [Algibacter lectus]